MATLVVLALKEQVKDSGREGEAVGLAAVQAPSLEAEREARDARHLHPGQAPMARSGRAVLAVTSLVLLKLVAAVAAAATGAEEEEKDRVLSSVLRLPRVEEEAGLASCLMKPASSRSA